MAKIISFGNIDPKKFKENPVKAVWQTFETLDKFTKLFFISGILFIASTPFIINSVLTTRQYASDQPVIESVEVSPGSVDIKIGDKAFPLSALAYSTDKNGVFNDVYYEWGISSTNSIGSVTQVSGNITEFIPKNPGYGDLFVVARQGDKVVKKAVQVIVRNANGELPPGVTAVPTVVQKNPFKISTSDVLIDAEDFYFIVNGKKYTANTTSMNVVTDLTTKDETNIKASWMENGEDVYFYAHFKRDSVNLNRWNITIFQAGPVNNVQNFLGNYNWGNFGNFGYYGFWQAINLYVDQNNPDKGNLYLGNVRIFPFRTQITPTPVSPTPTEIIVTPTRSVTPTPYDPTPTRSATPTVSVPTPTAPIFTPTPNLTLTPTPIGDKTAPTIVISYPKNLTRVNRGAVLNIRASASDDKAVQKVEIFAANKLICTDYSYPYNCDWKVPSRQFATHKINAKAYDFSGNKATSSSVWVYTTWR